MTTLNLQIASDNNDADETGGAVVTLTNAYVRLLTSTYWCGLLFSGVTIPNGSTITACELVWYVNDTTNDDPGGLTVYFEKNASPAAFSTSSGNLSGRTRTTAGVTDSGTAVGVGDRTISGLHTALQELVNYAGGLSSANLVVLVDAGASTVFRVQSYQTSTANAPRLNITYTPPAGGLTKQAMYYATLRGGL